MKSFIRNTLVTLLTTFLYQSCTAVPTRTDTALAPRQPCENTATDRACWGEYSIDTDWYTVIPDTGVTREYWLTVESLTLAPDGYERLTLSFNGTIPGPLIWANWGDTLVIHVTNHDPVNGTSIHWHGIRQLNTTEFDGVSGVTQCPIAPGDSMTYTFRATQYGTTWYHSHITLQYGNGLQGPLIIYGPATANYDEDLGTIFLADWAHTTLDSLWDAARVGAPPELQNGLVNGTNTYDCTGSTEADCIGGGKKFEMNFIPGTSYRLRIVNTAVDAHFQFSIDGHNLTVIANDLVPIVPYETDSILISIGQRYDVVVQANAVPDNYWIRSGWVDACSTNDNAVNITGILRYNPTSTADPTTNSTVVQSESCLDEPLASLVPYLALDVGSYTLVEETLDFVVTDYFMWTLNNSTLLLNWTSPTTLMIAHGEDVFPTDYNVIAVDNPTDAAEWQVIVIQNDASVALNHPIHLHGHDYWVLAQVADATFDLSTAVLNLSNPPRRDVMMLPAGGYLVLAFKLDNPGSWLMHCHIAWHASEGLALQFVENESQVAGLLTAVPEFEQVCAAWDAYVPIEAYPPDDSGI